jgi:hypothetical protein
LFKSVARSSPGLPRAAGTQSHDFCADNVKKEYDAQAQKVKHATSRLTVASKIGYRNRGLRLRFRIRRSHERDERWYSAGCGDRDLIRVCAMVAGNQG